ncbi:MAG TPA: PIN domain-containing protein [Bryobacteraceae bacterium]|nr:PIN domain-containing protein [Bryobacteraceae bacterium]
MATYFADISFWIGLSRKRDQHHRDAIAWHQFVIRTRSTILTTGAVLLEWLNAMSDVSTPQIAAASCLRIRADARIEIVPFQGELMVTAIELYRDRPDKNWSLTDCLSFVVMERRGLTEELTTDHDFKQASLKTLMLDRPSF